MTFNEKIHFHGLQDMFDKSLTNQEKHFRNFMKVFELLLLFTRAARQQLWELYLSTLHELAKYFFAYMFNYAQMTPVYLSQMNLKKDSETWEFFMNGYFSINKTSVPFTAIEANYAIKHENRTMKVLGGIKGIANDINKLGKYFTIAQEINQIIQDFCEAFDIKDYNARRDKHHELTGNKNQRITLHVQKVDETFKTQNVSFDESECVFNVAAKKVLNPKLAEEFLAHETIGKVLCQNFIKKRFQGEKSIWDPITKWKLPTFGSNVKTVTVKIKDQ